MSLLETNKWEEGVVYSCVGLKHGDGRLHLEGYTVWGTKKSMKQLQKYVGGMCSGDKRHGKVAKASNDCKKDRFHEFGKIPVGMGARTDIKRAKMLSTSVTLDMQIPLTRLDPDSALAHPFHPEMDPPLSSLPSLPESPPSAFYIRSDRSIHSDRSVSPPAKLIARKIIQVKKKKKSLGSSKIIATISVQPLSWIRRQDRLRGFGC